MKLNPSYLLLALLFVIIAITNYRAGTLLTGGDNLHPEFNPLLNIKRSIFAVWQEYQGLGLLGGMGHASDFVRQILVSALSLFTPVEDIRYLATFLYLFIGVFGAYFLLRKILKPFSSSDMFPLIGAVFYLLNLATIQAFYTPLEVFSAHFAFLPWLFWGTIRYFQDSNRKNALIFGAILLLATPGAYVPTLFLVFILSTIILFPFLLPGSPLINNLWKVGKFYLIIFIINAFWLLPFLYFAATGGTTVTDAKINQMSSDTNFLKNKEFGNISDAALLRGFWFNNTDFNLNRKSVFLMQSWREHLANPAVLGIGYLLFAIVALGALWTAKERRLKSAVGFLGIFIFAFAMLATATPPFSWLNSIFRQIPFFTEAFRFPFTKFSILASLTYSLFFALGLIYIAGVIRKFVLVQEKYPAYGLALLSAMILVIFTFPVFRGHLFYEKAGLKFPTEYSELFEFFKKQNPNTRIANFPQYTFWSWNFYEWGYSGSGFFWYGIEQPILDRAFDPWSGYNENYYWEISYALYSKKQELFEKIFEKYQINWILVDESVINPPSPKALFLDELEEMFKATDKFKLAATFGKTKVYRVQLDVPVNNFVYLAQNLPVIEPPYKWNNFDAAFAAIGHYTSAIQNTKYTIHDTAYFPFRSLFTGKAQNELEFKIKETENSFIFEKEFDKALANYQLEIPNVNPAGLTWINPYDLSHQKFLHPDVFFDGKSLTVEIPKAKGYFSEQIDPAYDLSLMFPKNCSQLENGSAQNEILEEKKEKENLFLRLSASNAINCSASFHLPDLPHNIGYLITVEARNKEGKSLLFWLENQNNRKADIETYLPKNTRYTIHDTLYTSYFIQPPMEKDGVGYTLHFNNISIGADKSINDLGRITINPIPYEFLTQISLQPIVPFAPDGTGYFPVDVEHPNSSLYLISKVTSQQDSKNSVLILSQAFNSGWQAYAVDSSFITRSSILSSFLTPIVGKRIENHVLVDNWANGWILDTRYTIQDTKIVMVFLPQYLEYLGFILLAAYCILLVAPKIPSLLGRRGLWYTKTKMADTDNKTLKDIITDEEEGKHEHNPFRSPAVRDEEEASGSSPSPTADDDIGEMVKEVTGREPEEGETFNEMVDEAEADRRGPPKEPEPQEET